jgi:nucleoside-triphosphatase THEP1
MQAAIAMSQAQPVPTHIWENMSIEYHKVEGSYTNEIRRLQGMQLNNFEIFCLSDNYANYHLCHKRSERHLQNRLDVG